MFHVRYCSVLSYQSGLRLQTRMDNMTNNGFALFYSWCLKKEHVKLVNEREACCDEE